MGVGEQSVDASKSKGERGIRLKSLQLNLDVATAAI